MSLVNAFENDKYEEEYQEYRRQTMPSRNHSLTVGRLTGLLFNDERFTVMPELSLDISQTDLSQFELKAKDELVPDICLYSYELDKSEPVDEIKMAEMPLLAIDVLSPRQGVDDIIVKFQAYFALGVKSCWLVIPATESITIYSQPHQYKTFGTEATEVIDEIMDIRLPIKKVFRRAPNPVGVECET